MERHFDPHYYPEFLCPVCGDRETEAPDKPCHMCREQEMIDAEPWLDEPLIDPDDTDEFEVMSDLDDDPGTSGDPQGYY